MEPAIADLHRRLRLATAERRLEALEQRLELEASPAGARGQPDGSPDGRPPAGKGGAWGGDSLRRPPG
jgi:hypothetical protein